MLVDRVLAKLIKDFPEIEIERVDVLTHPALTWNDGIRMIPALKNKERVLSGILLHEEEIRRFLADAQ